MLTTRLFPCLLASALICLAGVVGCGSSSNKGVTVTGKVILPSGVHLAENDVGTVHFVAKNKNAKAAGTGLKKDLTFEFNNVPPGMYKVGVKLDAYPGTKDTEKRNEIYERVNARFNADTNSPLTYEVTANSPQAIVIDLQKSTVSKQ